MIELRAGRLRCELEPEAGGGVAGLWLEGTPLLQAQGARPLVPFSNRMAHAEVVWHGTQQPLVRHTGDAPQAIHGLAWQRPWSVLDADETSAMLAFEHRPAAAWPFAFDCSHTVRLRPSGLELALGFTNQSAQPAPAGLAWRIALPRWPGARLPTEGALADWSGTLRLDGGPVPLVLRSELGHLGIVAEPDRLLLIPASHAAHATDTALLQPGESLVAQLAIELEGLA
ncbi:hypothetical protein H8N03_06075 [Ramlibacter sp. USB13]|uniref:Aldose 1-epimerase n=1 Tax=Ramlibacter cellulosilyticus TaxID=2764187 RepID=A0A923SAQ9_9BURK|nr:hypothetical protein [Ramlibacter cellulosilyticus]MBC5782503.1 hypothetical protein [Ramlibacter cellulosilyticus]